MVEKDDKRLRFIPLSKAIIAPDGICYHFKDRYWAYDPDRGVIFWKPEPSRRFGGFPQCNTNKDVTQRIVKRLYPWAEVKLIPSVFIPIDPRDYV